MLQDLAQATVHTSGVNWESVLAITGAIIVIAGPILGLLAWYVTTRVTGAINLFRLDVIDKLDRRISRLELLALIFHPTSKEIDDGT